MLPICQAVKDAVELAKLVQLTGSVCGPVGIACPKTDDGMLPST